MDKLKLPIQILFSAIILLVLSRLTNILAWYLMETQLRGTYWFIIKESKQNNFLFILAYSSFNLRSQLAGCWIVSTNFTETGLGHNLYSSTFRWCEHNAWSSFNHCNTNVRYLIQSSHRKNTCSLRNIWETF